MACQAPLSMGFSRQEYWNEYPFSSPVNLPDPGIEPRFPALEADSLLPAPPGGTSKQRVKTPNADGGRECEGSWLDGEHGKQEQMFLLQGAAAIQLKSPAM